METKTIRISFAGAKIVKNQATRLGKSQVDWINQAVEFINKTGFDIFDFEKTKSQSVEDRIISFIKKREQKYFDPMEQYFLESKDLLSKVLKNLNDLGIVDLLDIEDKIGDFSELRKQAEIIFRNQNQLAPDARLSATGFTFKNDQFHLPENIGSNDTHILLHYNNYEIGDNIQHGFIGALL